MGSWAPDRRGATRSPRLSFRPRESAPLACEPQGRDLPSSHRPLASLPTPKDDRLTGRLLPSFARLPFPSCRLHGACAMPTAVACAGPASDVFAVGGMPASSPFLHSQMAARATSSSDGLRRSPCRPSSSSAFQASLCLPFPHGHAPIAECRQCRELMEDLSTRGHRLFGTLRPTTAGRAEGREEGRGDLQPDRGRTCVWLPW